jgi:hypothetical protein
VGHRDFRRLSNLFPRTFHILTLREGRGDDLNAMCENCISVGILCCSNRSFCIFEVVSTGFIYRPHIRTEIPLANVASPSSQPFHFVYSKYSSHAKTFRPPSQNSPRHPVHIPQSSTYNSSDPPTQPDPGHVTSPSQRRPQLQTHTETHPRICCQRTKMWPYLVDAFQYTPAESTRRWNSAAADADVVTIASVWCEE